MRASAMALLAVGALHGCATAPPPCTLAAVDFLPGTWVEERDGTRAPFVERWRRDATTGLVGSGGRAAGAQQREGLAIRPGAAGLDYLAQPPGQPTPVAFSAATCRRGDVEFVNPAHDFPQRIHYRLQDNGTLRIDVFAGERGFTLHLRRQGAPE